ncbi:MAG TPA: PEGA domain-containing protein [Gemmatimonadales bacterium]|nr:PEGA domain-containing protein [Gemmatimonadales bacterium]
MVAPNPERPPEAERPPTWPVVFIEPDPAAQPLPRTRKNGWIVLAIIVGLALPVTTWFAGRASSRATIEPVPVPMPAADAPAPAPPATPPRRQDRESAPLPLPAAARPAPKRAAPPAARPSVASTAPAHVFVNAVPWGLVSIDDNPIGNTPLVGLPLAPGTHRIRVEHAGYVGYEREITLAPGEALRLTDIVLQEAPQ